VHLCFPNFEYYYHGRLAGSAADSLLDFMTPLMQQRRWIRPT
jgi:hypothetical protein